MIQPFVIIEKDRIEENARLKAELQYRRFEPMFRRNIENVYRQPLRERYAEQGLIGYAIVLHLKSIKDLTGCNTYLINQYDGVTLSEYRRLYGGKLYENR